MAFLRAATVLSVRNATIFFPFSIVFSIGARLTPLMANVFAVMRSRARIPSGPWTAMIEVM